MTLHQLYNLRDYFTLEALFGIIPTTLFFARQGGQKIGAILFVALVASFLIGPFFFNHEKLGQTLQVCLTATATFALMNVLQISVSPLLRFALVSAMGFICGLAYRFQLEIFSDAGVPGIVWALLAIYFLMWTIVGFYAKKGLALILNRILNSWIAAATLIYLALQL